MKPRQFRTKGIILSRTDFGEADRILTFITPDQGKVRVIAKGVRRSKSKLAGGIELFSISDISYVQGRGDISTLTGSRLLTHYGNIVKDIQRTTAAYEVLKMLDRATEDHTEAGYFTILQETLAGLDDEEVELNLIMSWFTAQLLKLSGHMPNLRESEGKKLDASGNYDFDFNRMEFVLPAGREGAFSSKHIKLLRLCFDVNSPKVLSRVDDSAGLLDSIKPLLSNVLSGYVRL